MASDSRTLGWHGTKTTIPQHRNSARRQLQRFLEGLIYSGGYIAVIAGLEVVISMLVLDLAASMAPIAVGCITFTIYAYDRLVDADTDASSNPERTAFVEHHRRSLSAAAAVAYGLALTIAVANGPLAMSLALFPAGVWVLYAVDWAPSGLVSISRLKEVFLVNSLLVAVAWGVTVVLCPIVFTDGSIGPTAWVLIVYFGVGTFVGTEIANARDIDTDEHHDISTLPARVGLEATQLVLYGIVGAGLGMLAGAWATGLLGAVSTIALGISLVTMAGVVAGLDTGIDEAVLSILGECARLPSLAILLGAVILL